MTTSSFAAEPTISSSSLEEFFQEVLSNSVLQEKIKAATDLQSLCQIAVKLGEDNGYHFNIKEVQAAAAVEGAIGCQWRAEDDLRVKSIDFDLPSGDGSNWGASQCHTCD